MKRSIPVLVCLLALSIPSAAAEKTIFAPPARSAAGQTVGNWAVTANGNSTHFVFAVPSDFAALDSASVVVVGKVGRPFDWEAAASLAQDGDNEAVQSFETVGAGVSIDDVLQEIDITDLFTSAVLAAGDDYVGVSFSVGPSNAVQVLGLRFHYNTTLATDGPTIVTCEDATDCLCPTGTVAIAGGVDCASPKTVLETLPIGDDADPTIPVGWHGECHAAIGTNVPSRTYAICN